MKTAGRDPEAQSAVSVICPGPRQKRVESAALFQGRREIVIEHLGTEYRLRITKGDKLILTK